MVLGQQVRPGQITAVPAVVTPAELDISTLLASIMPLFMIMMVFMILSPMMKSMAEAFKASNS